jgi:hypothetical protein
VNVGNIVTKKGPFPREIKYAEGKREREGGREGDYLNPCPIVM